MGGLETIHKRGNDEDDEIFTYVTLDGTSIYEEDLIDNVTMEECPGSLHHAVFTPSHRKNDGIIHTPAVVLQTHNPVVTSSTPYSYITYV